MPTNSTPAAAPPPADPTPVYTAPMQYGEPRRRGMGGLAVAGIVVGSVIVAGALFGGGVAVGSHLDGRPGMSQFLQGGENRLGPNGFGNHKRLNGRPGTQGNGQQAPAPQPTDQP